MTMHEHEKDGTLASHGDEIMIMNRYNIKVLVDKTNYIILAGKILLEGGGTCNRLAWHENLKKCKYW